MTGIHFLLTYSCTYECDHCFLYCSPSAKGTFTLAQLRQVFDQIDDAGGFESVYFEGGEPFLYHPLLVEGVRLARARGLDVGIVTNCYWATAKEDARLWLSPLVDLGLADLSVSEDEFHGAEEGGPAQLASAAAESLGMPIATICIEQPIVAAGAPEKGEQVTFGSSRIRGRAAEKLIEGLPRQGAANFVECKHEELRHPRRVHLDPFGNMHLCQGLIMGNLFETPLKEILATYDPEAHPIVGPLLRGGPAELARHHGVELCPEGYVEECHLCYETRKALIKRYPKELAPPLVYGLQEGC